MALATGLGVWFAVAATALAASPPNDNFANAEVLPADSATAGGTNVEATREPGEPTHGSESVWYRWTPSSDGKATVNTCASDFDTSLFVYTGDRVDALTRVAENEDSDACDFLQSQVRFAATGGTTYWIAVTSNWEETGNVGLEVRLEPPVLPPNDDFGRAAALAGYDDSARGTNKNATQEAGEPTHAGDAGGNSVWYRWTARAGGIAVVDTCSSRFDTVLAIYTGQRLDGLKRVAGDDNGCGRQSRVSFFAQRGTTYRLAVDGRGDRTGRVRIDLAQVKPGRYHGRTEFVESRPVSFKLSRDGRRVKRFTLSQQLDCSGPRVTGEFNLKRVWLKPMVVRKTAGGGVFSKKVVARFRDGGRLRIDVDGTLTPSDRARGHLRAKVTLPGGITCKNFLGSVRWRARQG